MRNAPDVNNSQVRSYRVKSRSNSIGVQILSKLQPGQMVAEEARQVHSRWTCPLCAQSLVADRVTGERTQQTVSAQC